MPARKSNISTISTHVEDVVEVTPAKASKDKDGLSVDDLSLPKSMIARLARGVLPANTQIHRDALLALHKSSTVFVSYIAANSNENAQAGGKKTIMPQDVMAALKDTEFERFIPRLEAELKKYNDTQCDKRNNYRRKVKEEKAANAPASDAADRVRSDEGSVEPASSGANGEHEDGSGPPSKKFKGVNGTSTVLDPADAESDADEDHTAEVNSEDEEADDDDIIDDDEHDDDEDQGQRMEDDDDDNDDAANDDLDDEALDEPDSD